MFVDGLAEVRGTLTTKETHSESQVNKKKTRRLTKFQFEYEFGEETVAYCIPHLVWHPGRITGSIKEHRREYELPDHIKLDASADGKQTELDTTQYARSSPGPWWGRG